MPIMKRVKRPKLTTNNRTEEYLVHADEPDDNLSNPLNLFDDSNRKDKMWMRIARKYLSRIAGSTAAR